ncbi:MAG: MBL fold metallo-hydrolase [Cyanobacteria bacterium MAG CAR4_bin_6]|nr:MBL fold metallo-hydrolase [Cyanobacteria bacterium MAG CAR4_bin_6]MCY4236583.1 MBL fold metallo-hydrolase [Cyanobacteria bacterium MAG CAR2_bin_4]
MDPSPPDSLPPGRSPQEAGEGLWVFAPNRDSRGTVSWLLRSSAGPLLVDVPDLTQANLALLSRQGSGRIVLTHRMAHGALRRLAQHLGWEVWMQEQEAYLLPTMAVQTFGQERQLADDLALYWTPGPTPGSCCLHWRGQQSVLFCGRLLQPQPDGRVAPVRTAHTFHWGRLLASLARLRQWLGPDEPGRIACSTGLVRLAGAALVDHGARALADLNLEALRAVGPGPNLLR